MYMTKTPYEHYFANENGEIFSDRGRNLRTLHGSKDKKGYIRVKIVINGKSVLKLVHRIIGETFLGLTDEFQINHKDGNPSNNKLCNLEVCTPKENVKHAFDTGLAPVGENHGRCKYSDELLSEALIRIKNGESVSYVAKLYGMSQSYLNKIKNGIYRKGIK